MQTIYAVPFVLISLIAFAVSPEASPPCPGGRSRTRCIRRLGAGRPCHMGACLHVRTEGSAQTHTRIARCFGRSILFHHARGSWLVDVDLD
jgi:hypothetical protein